MLYLVPNVNWRSVVGQSGLTVMVLLNPQLQHI